MVSISRNGGRCKNGVRLERHHRRAEMPRRFVASRDVRPACIRLRIVRNAAVAPLALCAGLAVLASCAPVRPWQRGRLASPEMQQRFGETGFAGEYRAKLIESKTGGGLPGDAPGGGCGCTQ